MGIFDIFTGDPVKDAAAKNAALYQTNEQQGLGYLNTGYDRSSGALNSGIGAYQPLTSMGQQYGQAPGLMLDALGVNGAAGNSRAGAAFQEAPGYQYQFGQGLQAVDRGAASRGMLNSGNTLMAEQEFGNNLANQGYNTWLGNLGGFTNPALAATAGAAGGQAAGYTSLANLGQTDAENRVNLGTTTASGEANSNTAGSNALMQGSGNFWNGLMSLGGNVAKGYFGGSK